MPWLLITLYFVYKDKWKNCVVIIVKGYGCWSKKTLARIHIAAGSHVTHHMTYYPHYTTLSFTNISIDLRVGYSNYTLILLVKCLVKGIKLGLFNKAER